MYIHGPELSDQVLLGVAAALVAAAAAYSRSYFTLSTSVAYTSAVRQLTSSAAVREVRVHVHVHVCAHLHVCTLTACAYWFLT